MFENPEQAFGGSQRMLHMIESIYAAAQDPALWRDVLEQISSTIHGESIVLFAGFPDARTPDILAIARMDPTAWAAYAEYYAAINPIMARCEQRFLSGTTWRGDAALNDDELVTTEFYNDFFRPNGMHYAIGLRMDLGKFPSASLSCQRGKNAGTFEDRADVVYQALRPHLRRALLLHHQIDTMFVRNMGLERALDVHEHAVLAVDAAGNVTIYNRAANAILQQGDGLRMRNSRLSCALSEENQRLQCLLHSVLSGGLDSMGGAMSVRRSGKPPLQVTVVPFQASIPGRGSSVSALMFLNDLSKSARSRAATMRTLYALTATEARVADLLLEGAEVRELSHTLNITLETGRCHVKRVLAKTGVRKQSELMRLMLALPGA